MHPAFREAMLYDNRRDLERRLTTAYFRHDRQAAPAAPPESVLLRLCRVQDDEALIRLAALSGSPAPEGRCVLAEVGGVVVAALPLGPGPTLADPFRPTAHLLPLLELRARQLADDRPGRRSRAVWRAVRGLSRA
jgi:hypothetical protein